MIAILVIGLGNPDRGDDALGLAVVDALVEQGVGGRLVRWARPEIDLRRRIGRTGERDGENDATTTGRDNQPYRPSPPGAIAFGVVGHRDHRGEGEPDPADSLTEWRTTE